MKSSKNLYSRHRYPIDLISHAVWLYFRSFNVGELLAARGVIIIYETVRQWWLKFERLRDRSFSTWNELTEPD